MLINAVIMSGGAGTRLWPLSDDTKPKQFLNLFGSKTMLQQTIERFDNTLFNDEVLLLANDQQSKLIDQQLSNHNYLIPPEHSRRNTAAAATAAALHISATQPNEDLILLAPADHVIIDTKGFNMAVTQAKRAALEGNIVTFGITPNSPEIGYGYIKLGTRVTEHVFQIETFKEKPDFETAKAYLAEGTYNWNAGIFLFSAHILLQEMKRFQPDILNCVERSYLQAQQNDKQINLESFAFAKAPSISIDYAIMEKTDKAAVIPCDFGWSDIGSYKSLRNVLRKLDMPLQTSTSKCLDAEGCLIRSDGPQVNIIGLSNIGVIVDQGRVLVLDLEKSQGVKRLVES